MKAKSKVLLGLLVALAMMVFAVPAFAEVTFTVSDPTPDSVVVMHNGTKAEQKTVKLTITEATSKATDEYTITPTVDGTAGATAKATVATAGTPVEYTYTTPDDLAVGNHTITFSVEKTKAVDVDTKGTKAPSKALTVKVINAFTATLNGATSPSGTVTDYTKDVVKGQDSGLSAYSDASSATYQWQSSSKVDEANDAKSTKWTNISGKTSAQLGTVDDLDGKYVRCLITNDGETVVAINSAAKDESTKTASMYAVKLAVNDTAKITLDETKMVDATYFVGQTTPAVTALEIAASGGSNSYTYKWIVDGVKDTTASSENTKTPAVTTAGTHTYAVEVTDTTTPTALTATSKTVTITVVDTPVLKMQNASNETPGKYTNFTPNTSAAGGDIVVAEADKAKDLVLTPVIENEANVLSYGWTEDTSTTVIDTNKTHTVSASDIATGKKYVVKVAFKGIPDPLTYTATLKVSSGSITAGTTGGIFTQVDSSVTARPEYTVTLPAGTKWGSYFTDATSGLAANAEISTSAFEINVPDSNVKAKLKTKITEANADKPLVFYLDGASTTIPYVEDMTLTIHKEFGSSDPKTEVLAKADASSTTEIEDVILPVSKDIGYKITKTADNTLVEISKPEEGTGAAANTHPTPYTGDVNKATLAPTDAAAQNGLKAENIKNVRYYASTDANKTTPITEPVDVDTYTVVCDIEGAEKYADAKDVALANPLVITKVTLDNTTAKDYLEMDPTTVEYDGQNKGTTVTFKDGITKAGKVDKITYYEAGADTTTASPVVPVKVGKYDVYVTTTKATQAATDEFDNIAQVQTTPGVKVGVFEITKTQADAKNYTIDPAEVTADGTPRDAIVKVADGAGKVTAKHYFKDGSEEELKDIPSAAGVYTVKVDTEENDTYAEGKMLEIGTFTIKEEESEQPEIWMIGHVEGYGWGEDTNKDGLGDGKAVKLEAGKTAQVGTTGESRRVEAVTILVPEDYTVEGFAHVQDVGDADVVDKEDTSYITNMSDIPEGYKAYRFGTTGKSKRVEAVNIAIKDADGKYVDGFEYATHVQNQGWLGSVRNGSFSGSRGQSLRMEAIRFYYDDVIRKPTDIDAETK